MAVRPNDPEALYLYQLIGAPLLAVVQAEAQATQVSAEFIKRVGFDPPKSQGPVPAVDPAAAGTPEGEPLLGSMQDGGEFGDLRMARFQIDRMGADGQSRPHVAQIPVLSMFPIPLLQVKHADFEFDIRILTRVPLEDQSRRVSEQVKLAQAHEQVGDPLGVPQDVSLAMSQRKRPSVDFLQNDRVELKGFLASARGGADGRPSMEASIKVKVRMEQSDLPAGLIHLMSMMGESVAVAPQALIEQGRRSAAKPAGGTE
jgi:uncharacterized protein DUF2589